MKAQSAGAPKARQSPGAAFAGREAEAPWGDRRWPQTGVSYVNPPTWGLSAAPVEARGDNRWYLRFAWAAIPPMVALRRIVLPVARLGGPSPARPVSKR
jgi:hypothetical protein